MLRVALRRNFEPTGTVPCVSDSRALAGGDGVVVSTHLSNPDRMALVKLSFAGSVLWHWDMPTAGSLGLVASSVSASGQIGAAMALEAPHPEVNLGGLSLAPHQEGALLLRFDPRGALQAAEWWPRPGGHAGRGELLTDLTLLEDGAFVALVGPPGRLLRFPPAPGWPITVMGDATKLAYGASSDGRVGVLGTAERDGVRLPLLAVYSDAGRRARATISSSESRAFMTADGAVYVTDGFSVPFEFDGHRVVPTSTRDGLPPQYPPDRANDIFVARAVGRARWFRTFGNGTYNSAVDSAVGPRGTVALLGVLHAPLEIGAHRLSPDIVNGMPTHTLFLAVLSSSGAVVGAVTLGPTLKGKANVTILNDDTIIVLSTHETHSSSGEKRRVCSFVRLSIWTDPVADRGPQDAY